MSTKQKKKAVIDWRSNRRAPHEWWRARASCDLTSELVPSGAGGDAFALMGSSGAGDYSSQSDQDDIPRMKVFLDRVAQDDHRERTTRSPRYASQKAYPIEKRQIFLLLRRRSTPDGNALEHYVLDRGARDGVRRRTKGRTFKRHDSKSRARVPALRREHTLSFRPTKGYTWEDMCSRDLVCRIRIRASLYLRN